MKQFQQNRYRFIFLLMLFVSVGIHTHAQKTSLRATVEPSQIMIGQQAAVSLQIITPKERKIQLPLYKDQMIPGVEVLNILKPDTTIENNVMTLNVKYIITSFDSTLYFIDSIPIFDGQDTLYSNSFGLKVISPELSDSTLQYLEKIKTGQTDSINFDQLQLHDIKPIQKVPFSFLDFISLLWIPFIGLLLLLLVAAIIFFVLRKKKKGYFFTPPIVRPAHERAVEALSKVKQEKLWQQGRIKEFYTQVTDILRQYIWERYRINALEMTSGEILNEIRKKNDTDSVFDNLKQILSTSDLVKFAKYTPFTDENDLTIMNAFLFVNQTREADPLPEKEEIQEEEQEQADNK